MFIDTPAHLKLQLSVGAQCPNNKSNRTFRSYRSCSKFWIPAIHKHDVPTGLSGMAQNFVQKRTCELTESTDVTQPD
jgi:hypothetical protein